MVQELKDGGIKLTDIINLDFLQQFQDAFAKATSVASITVDDTGPITKPSNFSEFCIKHSRGSKLGYSRCNKCDIEYGKYASEKGEPIIYNCHAGLTDFAVPIMLNGKQIASILGGQVLTHTPDENYFIKIARELNIDENEYIQALRKIKIVPLEQVEEAAKLLFLVANSISEMAEKNYELIKKNRQETERSEREALLRKITENIRSSFNINSILSYICDEMAKVFNVERATIIKYHDNENFSDFEVMSEFKKNNNIVGILNNKTFDFKVGEVWASVLESDDGFLAIQNIQDSNMPEFFKENYNKIGQKSIIMVPIRKDSIKWGVIILSEYDNYREWTPDDIKMLRIISDQIYLALKQSELYNQMEEQVEREKALLNNIPFLVWLKDKNGKYINANKACVKFCNYSIGKIIGSTDYDLFSEELAKRYTENDLKIINSKKPRNMEKEMDTPDGKKWYEIFKSPVLDKNGDVIGLVGFARDITERRELDIMKNEFISMISHELRTPLTSIRGSIGLVLSNVLGEIPEKANSLLNIANNNAIRLGNLINDILDLEKIKAGKMDFAFDKYNAIELVEESVHLNESYAKQYKVNFEVTNKIEYAPINVDKNRFIQVITNLLSNAAKFSFANETVQIITDSHNYKIKISVINKGNGIPQNAFHKIFKSFSQVDSSDSRKSGGTGLGLNICKSIIEKMHGKIGFESIEHEYTTFYVEFKETL